jgi:DNA-binding NarL/FixJ family response regulator
VSGDIDPSHPDRLRIVIADDQTVVRDGLQMLLGVMPDLEVVAAVADGEQALAAVAEHHPDAVLLDLHMPVLDGVGTTERLTREHPDVAIVVLTTYADDETIIAALKAGARGYLTKNADRREISQALHGAATGNTTLPPEVAAMLLTGAASARPARPSVPVELPDDLTAREAEVLKLLAAGLSNGEIARELFISEHTVKSHINHVFTKTRSRDRAQAIRYAHEHQLT